MALSILSNKLLIQSSELGARSSELEARSSEQAVAPSSELPAPSLARRMKVLIIFSFMITCCIPLFAEDKNWSGKGDGSAWTDDANWLPTPAPGHLDDATVNLKNASATISQPFEMHSLTVSGKKKSTVTVSNFTIGDISPSYPADNAVFNRRDGNLVLKGSVGKMTLKGTYKDSEEVIPEEPSLMLYVK